jgi:AraC-like DNA-binding protein/mannose-6-phosphate isomerase-like protein (cupin superfamily)
MLHRRHRPPELEHLHTRAESLGYEPRGASSFLRYLEHGFPNPLVRWHYHEEFELHYIVDTRGKVFVGDYIGHFEPGHLVLTGPRLPHNWISTDTPAEGVPLRDMVIQFPGEPLRNAAELIPEIKDVLPLLERARFGIEFFGMSELAQDYLKRLKKLQGLPRFSAFISLLGHLAQCNDYRMLSSVQLQSFDDDDSLAKINDVVSYITDNCTRSFSMAEVAQRLGMSESQFSRYFSKATGNSFTDFVSRLRINKACQLLMETDLYITNVCYDVGFNNVANFNRRFLQVKGMTPKEFRRQAEARYGLITPAPAAQPLEHL